MIDALGSSEEGLKLFAARGEKVSDAELPAVSRSGSAHAAVSIPRHSIHGLPRRLHIASTNYHIIYAIASLDVTVHADHEDNALLAGLGASTLEPLHSDTN